MAGGLLMAAGVVLVVSFGGSVMQPMAVAPAAASSIHGP
jgi:hypothetical protein